MGKDTIYRQDAIDAIRAMQTYKLFAGDDLILVDQAGAQTELMMLPSAEPKKGKWIERWHDNKHIIGDMACSVCGAKMLLTFPRFCPCCGAYMREEEQNETHRR